MGWGLLFVTLVIGDVAGILRNVPNGEGTKSRSLKALPLGVGSFAPQSEAVLVTLH